MFSLFQRLHRSSRTVAAGAQGAEECWDVPGEAVGD